MECRLWTSVCKRNLHELELQRRYKLHVNLGRLARAQISQLMSQLCQLYSMWLE